MVLTHNSSILLFMISISFLSLSLFTCDGNRARAEDLPRMQGNHEFLVRRDHPSGHTAAGPADTGAACSIGLLIEFQPEPPRIPAHAGADGNRVFADAVNTSASRPPRAAASEPSSRLRR